MLKVITFNILCGGKEGNTIPERAPRLNAVVKPYDADLIGLQEATEVWMPYLEEYFGEEYEIFNHWRKESNHESTPMLWKKDRFECLDKGYFWYSDTPNMEFSQNWDTMGCNRICMWAKLRDKKDGTTFTFFNTHYGFGDAEQIKSGELLLKHIEAMGGPCLVTADFNMFFHSPGFKKLEEKLVNVNKATVNDSRPTCHGFRLEANSLPIDFCFITPETITPLKCERIDTLVDGKFPSDHYGVYHELEIHQPLSLLSLNVWCGGKEKEAKLVRQLVRKEEPDIIGLQEVTPVFEAELHKLNLYDMALKYRNETRREGTPILWRTDKFDLIHEEHFWLSETPDVESKGWNGACLRIASLVVLQYKGGGKKFAFLNTHFDFASEHHIESVKLIAKRLERFADLPILLSADYNMTPGSAGYKAMCEHFRDVRWEVAPRDNTPTTNSHGKCVNPSIIDYVFVNENIEPKSYRVINSLTKDGYISDHNGLYTTYLIK